MTQLKPEIKKESVRLTLRIQKDIYDKIQKKSKKLDYNSIQEYLIEIARRDVNRKKVGGRPLNHLGKVENVVTRKKVLVLKGGGIFPNKL